jgi:hypothetical protein
MDLHPASAQNQREATMGTPRETTVAAWFSAATPTEAAALLTQLHQGAKTARRAAAQAYGPGEYRSRRAMAVDLDDVLRDTMWQTFESGFLHPGEDVPAFAQRIAEQDAEAGQ